MVNDDDLDNVSFLTDKLPKWSKNENMSSDLCGVASKSIVICLFIYKEPKHAKELIFLNQT